MNHFPSLPHLPAGILSLPCLVRDPLALEGLSVDGERPKGLIQIKSLEELAEVLKESNKGRTTVIPRGSGTKMSWGNVPRSLDLLVDMRGLNRVVEYTPENLTVTAECGISLGRLQEVLAAHGQFLPLDPPFFSIATLGGIVSCNASGPHRLIYGTLRDMVLGMKVVTADGSIASFGGRCVKNVTGYDMVKGFIGSLGTLGVIAEVTLKVRPLPEREVIQVASFPTPESGLLASRSLLHSVLFPAALELLDPFWAEAWRFQVGLSCGERDWLMLIGWVGFQEDVDRMLREGSELIIRHGGRVEGICEAAAAKKGWEAWSQLPHHLEIDVRKWVRGRLSFPLADAGRAILEWQRQTASLGVRSALSIRAGSGILFGHLFDVPEGAEEIMRSLEGLREWTGSRGGRLVLETAPLWIKSRMDVWGEAGKQLWLMRRLKEKFDPGHILNPGRYVGGI
jgi:glycolate oxidase FAD binding subunit